MHNFWAYAAAALLLLSACAPVQPAPPALPASRAEASTLDDLELIVTASVGAIVLLAIMKFLKR